MTKYTLLEEAQKYEILKLEQEVATLKNQIEFLKKRDNLFTQHYLSLKDMYNKELKKLDIPDVRILLAQEADKDRNVKTNNGNS